MTDAYGEHSQFVVLVNDRRRRWFDAKTVLLLTIVTMPVIIFCGIYMLILSSNEKVAYPRANRFQAPQLWLNRAKIYANHPNSTSIDRMGRFRPKFDDSDDFKLVCYYNFPNDDGTVSLIPQNIDATLCTHINVGFLSIAMNKLHATTFQAKIIHDLIALKESNGNLKVMVTVGGYNNDVGFPEMVRNHTNRKTFIRSVVDLVKSTAIDGIDLDWEFPNQNQQGDKEQKMHFTQLLAEMRKTIDRQSTKHRFLLSVAVAAPPALVDVSYDVAYMNEYVDYVNLMSYDCHFYTKFTPFTGFNAPLYKSMNEGGYFAFMNINYTAYYWLSKGMDRRKIIVGLPTYGHSFRLVNIHNNGLYAPARGYGKLGSNGFADFNQICKFLETNRISPVFDLDAKSPYATKSVEWISFDNELSLSYKAEFIRDNQFGGAMIYSLNTDDHTGFCNFDKQMTTPLTFPLTNRVKEVLNQNYSIF